MMQRRDITVLLVLGLLLTLAAPLLAKPYVIQGEKCCGFRWVCTEGDFAGMASGLYPAKKTAKKDAKRICKEGILTEGEEDDEAPLDFGGVGGLDGPSFSPPTTTSPPPAPRDD